MKAKPILHPTQYKNCIITPTMKKNTPTGYDVIDSTGRWFHVSTQKQAKWWSAVYTRIENEFAMRSVRAVPKAVEDHTPNIVSRKTKGA
jgi:hypothetical protein